VIISVVKIGILELCLSRSFITVLATNLYRQYTRGVVTCIFQCGFLRWRTYLQVKWEWRIYRCKWRYCSRMAWQMSGYSDNANALRAVRRHEHPALHDDQDQL